jgi:hypothetical protein
VLEGVHELDGGLGHVNNASLSGLEGDSLGVDLDALSLGLALLGVVLSDSPLEGLAALGSAHMLNSDVNSLGDDPASVLLVDHDSDGVLGHVEDAAGLSMVELVGHALVDGTVGYDVNEVSLLVSLHDLGEVHGAMLSEGLREQVSGSCSVTVAVRHLYFLIVK